MQVHEGQRLVGVDLDQGKVLLWIARDIARLIALVVVCDDLDFKIGRALDDVLVGYDVAARIDQKSGAETLQALPDFAWAVAVNAEKLRGKIIKRVANLSPNDAFGVDVHDRRQNLRDREHGGLACRIDARGGRTGTRLSKGRGSDCRSDKQTLQRAPRA